MNESIEKITIGIDVSKESLDIWITPKNEHSHICNHPRNIGQWLKQLLKKYPSAIEKIVLEPTGGYEKKVVQQLLLKDMAVAIVHPSAVDYFGKGEGIDAKTDKLDARKLAEYGADREWPLCSVTAYAADEKLRELSSRRRQLKEQIHHETCRSKNVFFHKALVRSHQRHIKAIKRELARIDQLIDEEMARNEEKTQLVALLSSFRGVGRIVSQTLVLDLPELGHLNRYQIAKLVGVAPLNRDSGKKVGLRSIKGGRQQVRRVLYMSALVSIRFNPLMKSYYEQLRARGKTGKCALVAVMRKMIWILNAMARDKTAWQKEGKMVCP